jgi:hypothetical protein
MFVRHWRGLSNTDTAYAYLDACEPRRSRSCEQSTVTAAHTCCAAKRATPSSSSSSRSGTRLSRGLELLLWSGTVRFDQKLSVFPRLVCYSRTVT